MATVRTALFSSNEPSRQPTLRLFRLFGIQFTANWIWVLLFPVVIYVAYTTFRGWRMGFSQIELWALGLVAALLSVASLYGHELAHALVARAYGIPVRRVSLFLLGGMAHIARESPSPRAEFLIAFAGPCANLAIGIVGLLLSWALADVSTAVTALGLWLAAMNIPLGIFNLVPASPLDGGRVLRAILWFAGQELKWASTVSARVGQMAAVGLLFSGVWILFDGSAGALGGLWLIMSAWFMYAGAVSLQYATQFHDSLRRLTVASVMDRDFLRVQVSVSIQAFAQQHVLEKLAVPGHYGYAAVYRDEDVVGLLNLRQIGRIPVQTWPQTSVERVMLPIAAAPVMEPSAPALGALHLMLEEAVELIAVMAEGRLLGLVSRAELARASAHA